MRKPHRGAGHWRSREWDRVQIAEFKWEMFETFTASAITFSFVGALACGASANDLSSQNVCPDTHLCPA
jgi:hypothetical protein